MMYKKHQFFIPSGTKNVKLFPPFVDLCEGSHHKQNAMLLLLHSHHICARKN